MVCDRDHQEDIIPSRRRKKKRKELTFCRKYEKALKGIVNYCQSTNNYLQDLRVTDERCETSNLLEKFTLEKPSIIYVSFISISSRTGILKLMVRTFINFSCQPDQVP